MANYLEVHKRIQLRYTFGVNRSLADYNMATAYVDKKDCLNDGTKADAKDALLGALFLKNCTDIETVLQEQPALVNFEYEEDGKYYGTPLLHLCSYSMNEEDEELTGMYKNHYVILNNT